MANPSGSLRWRRWRTVAALLTWIVVSTVPGAAACLILRPKLWRSPLILAVIAPAATFALAGIFSATLEAFGIGPWPGLAISWVILVILAAARLLQSRHDGAEPAPEPEPTTVGVPGAKPTATGSTTATVLLVAAMAIGAVLWATSVKGAVPPNRDSTVHGYFAARIARENTVDPTVVLAESPANPDPVADYYPLSLHTQVAVTHRLTGVAVADLLLAGGIAASVIYLPLGMFALARRLVPDRPELAGFAALVATTAAVFPYQPMWWGGLTLVVGLCLVPGVLAYALETLGDRDGPAVVVAALAVAGTVLVHPSQLALLAILFAAFFAQDLLRTRPLRPVIRSWSLFGVACGVLLVPYLLALASGASERAEHMAAREDSLITGLQRLVWLDIDNGATQPLLGLLAIGGLVLATRRRELRPLTAVVGFLGLLFLASTVGGPLWDALGTLSVPWYRSWWRLLYNVALFLPIFVALVLDEARRILARSLPERVAAGALTLVPLVAFAPAASSTLRLAFEEEVMLDGSDLALMQDMADTIGEEEVVLNQENDATLWMYATAGLRSFSGFQGFERSADAADRDYLLEHLNKASNDAKVRELLDRWHIHYVMVNDNTYMSEKASIDPEELRRAPGFTAVDHSDSLWVFEIER